jgi:hypothetical protein
LNQYNRMRSLMIKIWPQVLRHSLLSGHQRLRGICYIYSPACTLKKERRKCGYKNPEDNNLDSLWKLMFYGMWYLVVWYRYQRFVGTFWHPLQGRTVNLYFIFHLWERITKSCLQVNYCRKSKHIWTFNWMCDNFKTMELLVP